MKGKSDMNASNLKVIASGLFAGGLFYSLIFGFSNLMKYGWSDAIYRIQFGAYFIGLATVIWIAAKIIERVYDEGEEEGEEEGE